MKAWIEVSTNYRFDKKIIGENGLVAPASTRYINMMKNVKSGDIILHYIIKQGAKKEYRSSIIGISKAKSEMYEETPRILIDLLDTTLLTVPIRLNEINELDNKSESFSKLIRMSFLRYLSEITLADLDNILKIHPENLQCLTE